MWIEEKSNDKSQATSKSDDESSASLYEYIKFGWQRLLFLLQLFAVVLLPIIPLKADADDPDSFKLHFNELLFK